MEYYLLLVVRVLTADRCRIRHEAEKCGTDECEVAVKGSGGVGFQPESERRTGAAPVNPKPAILKGNYNVRYGHFFTILLILIFITAHTWANHGPIANSNIPMGNTQAVLAIYTASTSYLPTTSTARCTGANSPRTSSPANGKSP